MSLADVEQVALKLSEHERGVLAAVLLESVTTDWLQHSPDELEHRERELDEGRETEIAPEELLTRIKNERGR